jgi:hypothetical protein
MIKGFYLRSFIEEEKKAGLFPSIGLFRKGEKTTSQVELKKDLTIPAGYWFEIEAFDPKEEELFYEFKGKWIKFPGSVINYIQKYSEGKNKDLLKIEINRFPAAIMPWLKGYDIFITKERQRIIDIMLGAELVMMAGIAGYGFYLFKKSRKELEEALAREKAGEELKRIIKLGKAREILGVSYKASLEDIKKAYRKNMLLFHEDHFQRNKDKLMKIFNVTTAEEAKEMTIAKSKELNQAALELGVK